MKIPRGDGHISFALCHACVVYSTYMLACGRGEGVLARVHVSQVVAASEQQNSSYISKSVGKQKSEVKDTIAATFFWLPKTCCLCTRSALLLAAALPNQFAIQFEWLDVSIPGQARATAVAAPLQPPQRHHIYLTNLSASVWTAARRPEPPPPAGFFIYIPHVFHNIF